MSVFGHQMTENKAQGHFFARMESVDLNIRARADHRTAELAAEQAFRTSIRKRFTAQHYCLRSATRQSIHGHSHYTLGRDRERCLPASLLNTSATRAHIALVASRCSKLAPKKNATRNPRWAAVRLVSLIRASLRLSCSASDKIEKDGLESLKP